jgi:hypothetical protein
VSKTNSMHAKHQERDAEPGEQKKWYTSNTIVTKGLSKTLRNYLN